MTRNIDALFAGDAQEIYVLERLEQLNGRSEDTDPEDEETPSEEKEEMTDGL